MKKATPRCGPYIRFATKHRMGLSSNELHKMILIIEIKKYIVFLSLYYLFENKFFTHLQVWKNKKNTWGKRSKGCGLSGEWPRRNWLKRWEKPVLLCPFWSVQERSTSTPCKRLREFWKQRLTIWKQASHWKKTANRATAMQMTSNWSNNSDWKFLS